MNLKDVKKKKKCFFLLVLTAYPKQTLKVMLSREKKKGQNTRRPENVSNFILRQLPIVIPNNRKTNYFSASIEAIDFSIR